jgi:hypothetical protein
MDATPDSIAASLDMARRHITAAEQHLGRGQDGQAGTEFTAATAWAALATAEAAALAKACPDCHGKGYTRSQHGGCCDRFTAHWHTAPCANPVHT